MSFSGFNIVPNFNSFTKSLLETEKAEQRMRGIFSMKDLGLPL